MARRFFRFTASEIHITGYRILYGAGANRASRRITMTLQRFLSLIANLSVIWRAS